MHRVLPVPGRLSRAAGSSQAQTKFIGPRFFVYDWRPWRCTHLTYGESARGNAQRRLASATATSPSAAPKVCPEGIAITDNAIIPLKERVVDEAYDPARKLLRMVTGKR